MVRAVRSAAAPAAAVLCVVISAGPPPAVGSEAPAARRQEFVRAGVRVRFEMEPAAEGKGPGPGLRDGALATVRFDVSDTSGAALTGLRPAAWLDLRSPAEAADETQCQAKIRSFLQASLSARPTVDLNTYNVLALNDDSSISVLDPLRGFGGSRLLALVRLESPGEDWALGRDGRRLFVGMPVAGKVAVIGTDNWKVLANVEAGGKPTRLALQGDGHYLWVGNEASPASDASTVTVVDTVALKPAGQIAAGAGPHDFAFTPDDRFAFVSNGKDGTVSVVDIRRLEKVKDVATGSRPTALAFSPLANSVYAVHEGDGAIVAIDAASHQVVARMAAEPGLAALRFLPGGRWGFAVNRERSAVHVFDASTNRIRYRVPVGEAPDQIAFTKGYAYVRSLASDQVTMISLAGLGKEGGLSVNEFLAGQKAPGGAGKILRAAAIVPALEPGAVLVANPSDRLIYYYAEGMAAPMGSFLNYRRMPKAVLVADRSLRETAPGVYAATVKLPASGTFDVAFLLDSPRVVHCFEATVDASAGRASRASAPRIEALAAEKRISLGSTLRLRLKVSGREGLPPATVVDDLEVLTVRAPGVWQDRRRATAAGDGTYEVSLTPPQAGVYYVSWQSPSLGVRYQDTSPLLIHVRPEAAANATHP